MYINTKIFCNEVKSMNFTSIEYFLAAAEEKSISRAAEKLQISQQTLSANIASLEKEFGTAFFVRSVPLKLTEAGEIFRRHALQMRQQKRMMMQSFSEIDEKHKAELRIGVIPALSVVLADEISSSFMKEHPDITVTFETGHSEGLMERLRDGDLDLVAGDLPGQAAQAEINDLYTEEIVMVIDKKCFRRCFGEIAKTRKKQYRENRYEEIGTLPVISGNEHDIDIHTGNVFLKKNGAGKESVKAYIDQVCARTAAVRNGTGASFFPSSVLSVLLTRKQLDDLYVFHIPEAYVKIRIGTRPERNNVIDDLVSDLTDIYGKYNA